MASTYYRLLDDMRLPKRWFLRAPTSARGASIDPRIFTIGEPVDVDEPLTIGVRVPGEPMQFTLADFDMPVLTRDFADEIRPLVTHDVQMVAARVEGQRGDFVILNAIGRERCLDESRSEVSYWTQSDGEPARVGQVRMVRKLRVDAEKAHSRHVFRIEGWTIALIVSRPVMSLLEDAVGAVFQDVS